jgi:MFS-type transporter involved in bile tolerance (Atg22 family)
LNEDWQPRREGILPGQKNSIRRVQRRFKSRTGCTAVCLLRLIEQVMHAIPSTGDAKSMWLSVKDVSPVTRLLVMPILGVIYLATIGRFFWLDLFYGIGVAIGLPTLAVAIYSYFV